MRIVVDAMGSDTCPVPDVEGAVLAARTFGDPVIVVGDKAQIDAELAKQDTTGLKLEVVHAAQAVIMTDKPGSVVKAKPESSMHVGMALVRDGKADGFISAGNTGAALSIATLATLRRIPGIKRPALTAYIRLGKSGIVVLDVGANADCRPEWLMQFALMGRIYAQSTLGIANPRVALLANGEEEEKGNEMVQATHQLMKANAAALNFVGNTEPKDMMKGNVDVVVCDGFVGNIMLKSLEGGTRAIVDLIRDELMKNVLTKVGGALSRPAFRRVAKQIDPSEVGGAPLLGINGIVMIGHGRSNANAIRNAVGQARKAVEGRLIEKIRAGLADMPPLAADGDAT